ncbi:MAG: outer membrane protein cobalt-zinc-cadmium efflux system [Betaproteobacteria bacterium]|nr:outer membrane protein cobalt-zinc-cadmium efflux system [Betaproteobacteria bacterium]
MNYPLFNLLRGALFSFLVSQGANALAQAAPDLRALTLPAAESLLASKNRDIAMARRALDQASADVKVAAQPPNPQLTLGVGSYNPSLGIGSGGPRSKALDSSVRIDQLLERGNKLGLRVENAKRLEQAAGEDLNDIGRQQLLAVRGAYFDLLAAQEKVIASEDTAQLFGKTVDAAQLRQRAGDLAVSDVSRVRVDALRAQNDARAAQADLSRARLTLAYLIGVDARAAEIRAVTPWPAHTLPDAAQAEALIDRRPDVRAAQARVDAADKARDLAQAQRTRDVSIGAQYDHYPVTDSNTLGTGNTFGVSVSVPLFLRNNNEGGIARAQADWYAARDGLDRVRALALSDVLRARSDLENAAERLGRFESDLLPAAQKSADAAEFAFKNGALAVMDLLDARRTLKSVLIDAANSRADYAKALAAWQSSAEAPADYMNGEKK